MTLILAAAGALLGAEYNVLSQLNLPRIPVDEGALSTGALIALAAIVLGTLLAAIAGGKEFGGLNWGSAFFGWLVAVGIATLLTALLSAAGAAVGLTEAATDAAVVRHI